VLTGAAALAGTTALWSLPFGRVGHLILRYVEETRDPVRAMRHAVSALMVMVAGLIAMAVANEGAIAHPHGHTSTILSVLLYGGPMLYLLAEGWYLRFVAQIQPRMQVIGSVALAVAGFATLAAPPYVALMLVGASLSALALLDRA
jgi:low temperature requirement protein LtrA